MRFGPRRIYLVNHPDAIEEVLVTRSRNFIKHFALKINPVVLGNGLLTSDGAFWRRQRRLMQPAFARPRIASYASIMVEYARRQIEEWQAGETRDLHAELMRLTLAITAKTLFDAEAGGQAGEVVRALRVAQEAFIAKMNTLIFLPAWVPTPRMIRLRRAVRRLDEIIYGFIQERRRKSDAGGNDLLSILLHARDEVDQTGMTDQQLRDEAMTLFLAGHETTALALSWAWYLLAQHPEAEARLAAEVQEVLGGRLPTADDAPQLRYVEKVVLESMRLYPPAYAIGRESLTDGELLGYHVPAGTTLLMCQWVVHRDGRFWDEPERFVPERWTDDLFERVPKFAYFPFGGGPRLCIGNTFAMLEMVLLLATIAQRWRFTLLPGHVATPSPAFTLRPGGGVPAVLARR
jgi:cytochrome P450